MNSYIGPKGYTLLKTELPIETQEKIRKELTIRPFNMMSQIGGFGNSENGIFPAYRESPTRFFVPLHYGINLFGSPKSCCIRDGEILPETYVFQGQMRDYQTPVISKYLTHVNEMVKEIGCGGGLLELHTGWGKTSAALYISSILKRKTLVIVHKTFLMNQWIERIKDFLPMARIGCIQGPTVDIDNKDIVLCMLQSLVQKNYSHDVFSGFGLTIIDECHHISSQTFSESLFKVVTKYMLGLSATMNRKDGTTDVFKMFLGDVIHSAERKNENKVEVRAITYKTNDTDFNDVIYDYRGNTQISSMISKLCSYSHRTEFILRVLNDHLRKDSVSREEADSYKHIIDTNVPKCALCGLNNNYLIKNTCCGVIKYCLQCVENLKDAFSQKNTKGKCPCPDCNKTLKFAQNYIHNPNIKPITQTHTIIMSHNLNILEYLYRKIVCKNLASVGYYVGGMKELELKESETKHVILATYSMCSEGLDIPSLNSEFLISPKTDVVQIVGRILRAKHATTTPTIYDFIDTHDVFQRQWIKRKSYYKKQNYHIVSIDNNAYERHELNTERWKLVNAFNPNGSGNIDSKFKKQSITNDDDDEGKGNTNTKTNKYYRLNTDWKQKSKSTTERSLTEDEYNNSETDTDTDAELDKIKQKQDKFSGKCLISL